MNVYYTVKPIISLNSEFRIEFDKGVSHFIEDVQVLLTLFENPLIQLQKDLEARFLEPVILIPSELQKKVEEYQNDPKNWPSEDDDLCPCCGK